MGDFIDIYNYQNNKIGKKLARVCGTANKVVTSKTNRVYVVFTSDASRTAKGFRIRYTWKNVPKGRSQKAI